MLNRSFGRTILTLDDALAGIAAEAIVWVIIRTSQNIAESRAWGTAGKRHVSVYKRFRSYPGIDCVWTGSGMTWCDRDAALSALEADCPSHPDPIADVGLAPVERDSAAVDWVLATLHHIPDAVCAKDIHGRIMTANRAMAASHGLMHPDELIGKTAFDLLPMEAAQDLSAAETRVIQSGKSELDVEQSTICTNGGLKWTQCSRIPLYNDNADIVGIVSVSRDISARKQSENLVFAQANLLDMVAQSDPIDEILAKIISVIEEHLPGASGSIRLLSPDGLSFQEPMVPKPSDRHPELGEDITAALIFRMAMSAITRAEPVIVPDIQADPLWLEYPGDAQAIGFRAFCSSPVFSSEGKALGVLNLYSSAVATPTDVQMDLIAMASHMVSAAMERKETDERTKFLASHDMLTGLPNRMMFEERLAIAIETARAQHSCIGLAFFDLDNFKLINDSLGHGAGDEFLKIVAERAKNNLRRDDLVARLGGDEFVLFLMAPPDQSMSLQERFSDIRQTVSAPIDLANRTLQVTCSMGVACFPDHAQTSSDLIARADTAMYRAKTFGRDNIQFFSADMADFAQDRLILNTQLRSAIAEGEFVLHYQPQVNLHSGRIFAAEALVRWRHPERGLLAPGEFIKTAEETGLIVPLGDWILLAACQQNKEWQRAGLPPIVVSVNVSARQFRESDWVTRVAAALEQSDLEADFLELELTESVIMQDMTMAVSKMRELEDLGVHLAIDDFGTGYSSLSVLKSLPVRRLKIDRSFVKDIPHDENDKALTAAIIVMARALNLRTIAEGVETVAQIEFLREHQCHEIQGYVYSRPVAPDEFEILMTKSLCHS